MGKIAFLLSGQGAQKPGMGAGLIEQPAAQRVFAEASEVFGFDVADLCLNAPAEKLNDTAFAQPAMLTLSLAEAALLEEAGVTSDYVAGFSLGQIGALAVAGMTSRADAFRIAEVRARLMADAAAQRDGAMCALMGGDDAEVEEVCAACAEDDVLVPANYNSPGQVVASGDRAAIERVQTAWTERPRHRAKILATSGAFHSPLMEPAAEPFGAFLANIDFAEARVPLVCNVDARPLVAADAANHLVAHLTHPVRFAQTVQWLIDEGVDTFIECGCGGVLTGLVKRIDRSAARFCVETVDDMKAALDHALGR